MYAQRALYSRKKNVCTACTLPVGVGLEDIPLSLMLSQLLLIVLLGPCMFCIVYDVTYMQYVARFKSIGLWIDSTMLPSISSIMCFSLCHPNDGLLYICRIGLSDCRGTKTAIWYNLYFSLVLNQTYSAILPTLGFGCVKSLPHIHPFYYLLTFL